MKNLQEVQNKITEMIKSEYPEPIFKVINDNKIEFEFDEKSWNGIMTITQDENGFYLEGTYADIYHSKTIDLFINEFKDIYEEELEQLSIYEGKMV